MHRLRPVLRGLSLCLLLVGGPVVLAPHASAQGDGVKAQPSPFASEAPTLRFEHLGLEDGLVQASVNTIMQDRQGFLWIATQGGLHRYDGYEFKVYAATPFDTTALSDNWVNAATEAKNGDLWVATNGGGLNRMDRATGTFTHYESEPDDSASLSSGRIFYALEDRDGDLWVSTFDRGLNRMRAGEDGRFTRYRHHPEDPTSLSSDHLFRISETTDGYLWVGSANGINRIDPETDTLTRFLYEPEASPVYGSQHNVLGQYHPPDEPGIVWLATGNGLVRLDSETGAHERFLITPNEASTRATSRMAGHQLNFLREVVPDPSVPGVLWVGGPATGLARFDTRTRQFTPYRHDSRDPHSLSENNVQSLLADRSGTVWVGTGTEGLSAFKPQAVNFVHLRHDPDDVQSLAPGIVWGVYEDRAGTLWVGTDTAAGAGTGDDYLTQFDAATGRIIRHQYDPKDAGTLPGGNLRVFAEDGAGQLWVGAFRGLSRIDPATGRVTRFPHEASTPEGRRRNNIFALLPTTADADVLWVGSAAGLDRFDARTGRFAHVPLDLDGAANDSPVMSLFEDAEGVLWAGAAGLVRIAPSGEATLASVHDPGDPTTISDNTILGIMERAEEPGILWLAIYDGGLDRFDTRTGVATHYTTKDGLANDHLYGILEDSTGTLWMSTNGGISSFDPETESFRNYGLRDGLMALEYNQGAFAKGPDGVLYFGSPRGVTAFVPERLHRNSIPPQVALTGFRLFNEPVVVGPDSPLTQRLSETEQITLAYDQNEVTFDYVGLHFANPAKNRYAYQLEGFDRDWVEAGAQRSATYTNLPPGRYTFHVKAANADGVWNEEGASVGLRITPPWWRTWWAYGLFALCFAGAVFAGDRFQRHRLLKEEREHRRQLEERQRELEATVEERTAEIQQRVEELAVINGVQEGLVAELDMQAIYDVVGDRLRDLFDAQVFGLATFDHEAGTEQFRYLYENGERFYPEPRPIDRIRRKLIETRELILINENLTETFEVLGEAAAPVPGTVWPKSVLYVPLTLGEQVLGYVTLQNLDREHAFTDGDVRLLSTVTNSMSVALENARLFAETNRLLAETEQRNAELAVINGVQEGLVAELDMQAIYDLVGDRVRDLFDAQVVVISMFDHEADLEHYRYHLENGEKSNPLPRAISAVRQHLIRTRQPIMVNEDLVEAFVAMGVERPEPVPGTRMAQSALFVPLVVGETVRGYVSLQNVDREHAFSEDDLRLLSTLANSMSVALENARLFDETNRLLGEVEQRAEELAVINSVQEGLVAELDMQAIYDLVGDRIRELFDAQSVMISTFDHDAGTEQLRYNIEKGEKTSHPPRSIDLVRRRLIETREPIHINEGFIDALVAMGYDRPEPVPGTKMPQSVLFVPLVVGETVRGYVSLQNIDREGAFSDSDVRLLSTLANSMSVALENARLFAETRQQAAELDTVNKVSRALVSQLEFDALVHLVGEQMRETFAADIVYVALHDREADMLRFPYEYGDKNPDRPFGSGLTEKIITTREPLLINRDMAEVRKQLQTQQIGKAPASYLGVPIMAGDEALGVISVQTTEEENRFDDDALRLLGTIAANVGVALSNAESYRRLNAALDHLRQAQAQLVQQEKLASLGALTAGIAHEIKNPLNFVTNFAELNDELAGELAEDLADHPEALAAVAELVADLQQNARLIVQHGQRADSIVRSMMAHARSGEGERTAVNVNAFVDEYVDLAYHGQRARVPDFNADIVRSYDEAVGEVELVPQEVGRVLINLLGNAFDAVYEHAGRTNGQYAPCVEVTTRRVGGQVEIRVEDNGGGMPESVREKIFEPFYTTKPTGQGTGLGLSMSHDIITQGHGGTLEVESMEGEGAAFVVSLPAAT